MNLQTLRARVDELARRAAARSNPNAALTTPEMRTRVCDLLGIAPGELAEIGPTLPDLLRAEIARRDSEPNHP